MLAFKLLQFTAKSGFKLRVGSSEDAANLATYLIGQLSLLGLLEITIQDMFNAWLNICSASWFKRVWVLQEVATSNDAILCHGEYQGVWSDAVQDLCRWSLNIEGIVSDVSDRYLLQHVYNMGWSRNTYQMSKHLPLSELLFDTTGFTSTDDKDKVFALLNLSANANILEADYNMATRDVFIQAVVSCFLISDDCHDPFKLLALASRASDNAHRQDLPSWALDFSISTFPGGLALFNTVKSYHASGEARVFSQFKALDRSILQVRGVVIDTIAVIHSASTGLQNMAESENLFKNNIDFVQEAMPYPTTESPSEILWRLQICDCGHNKARAIDHFGSFGLDKNLPTSTRPDNDPRGELQKHWDLYCRSIVKSADEVCLCYARHCTQGCTTGLFS
jgi:hypothetical protein